MMTWDELFRKLHIDYDRALQLRVVKSLKSERDSKSILFPVYVAKKPLHGLHHQVTGNNENKELIFATRFKAGMWGTITLSRKKSKSHKPHTFHSTVYYSGKDHNIVERSTYYTIEERSSYFDLKSGLKSDLKIDLKIDLKRDLTSGLTSGLTRDLKRDLTSGLTSDLRGDLRGDVIDFERKLVSKFMSYILRNVKVGVS